MSEAEAATDGQQLPASVVQEATETIDTETQETPPAAKSNGYAERVDLSGLPEDIRKPIEARLAHMSSLMRKHETKSSRELSEWKQLAQEQSAAIEELRSGVGVVVDHLQDKSLNETEAQVREQMRVAHESNNTMAFIEANEKLAEIKAQKVLLAQQKKATKQPKQETPKNTRVSAGELANDSFADGELSAEESTIVNAWVGETDEYGTSLRPWLNGDAERDPSVRRALVEAYAVFDPSSPWANKSIMEKLTEIDRRMGVQRRASSQAVLGGQLTTPRKSAKLTLSPAQEKLAVRTKFGGPKAKSDTDHIEAYRKQLETVKGSRK